MARGEVRMYKEEDGQVTLLYFVDDVLKSSQNNLANWSTALDAAKALIGNNQITPGTVVLASIEVRTN